MHISIHVILMSFSFEQEISGALSVLDVEISRQQGKFVTTVYRKPLVARIPTATVIRSCYEIHSS